MSNILAIGAQNTFVMRQGFKNQHVLLVCSVCSLSDSLLILLGVFFFDYLSGGVPWIIPFVQVAEAGYLIVYGGACFYSSLRRTTAPDSPSNSITSMGRTLITCLAITWLNPHVYLDTVVIIGSVSLPLSGEEFLCFGIGECFGGVFFLSRIYLVNGLVQFLKNLSLEEFLIL